MTNFSKEFLATHRAVSDVRQEVGAWLRAQTGFDEILIGDVEMVFTELASNVVDHTASPWVRVAIEIPGNMVAIEVANAGPAALVPAVEDWGQLAEGTRGRGLRIIRALSATVVVAGDNECTQIRCDIASTEHDEQPG